MNASKMQAPMAVLGGTFDPVHHGHLRLAIDLTETMKLDNIRLMPGFQPVHRDRPSATAEQRLKMLELAVADIEQLTVDDRELRRKGPSYTLLSLQELRAEIGAEKPLFFIMGEDAFSQLDSWYQWQDLIKYAHLMVAIRPGNHPKISQQLEDFVHKNEYKAELIDASASNSMKLMPYGYTGALYPETAAGKVVWMNNPILEIASSDIRKRIAEKRSIRYLLPASVYQYIKQQKIYC